VSIQVLQLALELLAAALEPLFVLTKQLARLGAHHLAQLGCSHDFADGLGNDPLNSVSPLAEADALTSLSLLRFRTDVESLSPLVTRQLQSLPAHPAPDHPQQWRIRLRQSARSARRPLPLDVLDGVVDVGIEVPVLVVSPLVQPAVVVLDQAEMKWMVEHVADSAGIPRHFAVAMRHLAVVEVRTDVEDCPAAFDVLPDDPLDPPGLLRDRQEATEQAAVAAHLLVGLEPPPEARPAARRIAGGTLVPPEAQSALTHLPNLSLTEERSEARDHLVVRVVQVKIAVHDPQLHPKGLQEHRVDPEPEAGFPRQPILRVDQQRVGPFSHATVYHVRESLPDRHAGNPELADGPGAGHPAFDLDLQVVGLATHLGRRVLPHAPFLVRERPATLNLHRGRHPGNAQQQLSLIRRHQ